MQKLRMGTCGEHYHQEVDDEVPFPPDNLVRIGAILQKCLEILAPLALFFVFQGVAHY